MELAPLFSSDGTTSENEEPMDETTEDEPELEYSIMPDMWGYLWVRFASSKRQTCWGAFVSVFGVACVALLQLIFVCSIGRTLMLGDKADKKGMNLLYGDTIEHLGHPGFRRLSMSDVIGICGDFDADFSDDNTFSYKKLPDEWNPGSLTDSVRSSLDDAIVVMDTEIHSIFGWTMLVAVFSWILVVLTEFFEIKEFSFMICQMPLDNGLERDDNEFKPHEFKSLRLASKLVGYVICVFRMISTTILFVVGLMLLYYTHSVIDLVLNSIGLGFITELDDIIYAGVIRARSKKVLENLAPLHLQDPSLSCDIVSRFSRILSALSSYITIILSAAGSVALRLFQIRKARQDFNLAATMCLFLGPDPDFQAAWNAVFPVAGFCESLLGCTCGLPDKWRRYQCLSIKFHSNRACDLYDLQNNESQYCNCTGFTGYQFDGLDVLTNACNAMYQKDPKFVTVDLSTDWLNDLNEKQYPKAPARATPIGFPRVRDADPAFRLYAGPFACQYEGMASNFLRDAVAVSQSFDSALIASCAASVLTTQPRALEGDPCLAQDECFDGFCDAEGRCRKSGCDTGVCAAGTCSKASFGTCSKECDEFMICASRIRPWDKSNCTTHLHEASGFWFYVCNGQPQWWRPHLCSWQAGNTPNGRPLCEDGTISDDWKCVKGGHGQRAQCPLTVPKMCAEKKCGDNLDYCCEKYCSGLGGERPCIQTYCFTNGASYQPLDMTGQTSSRESSASACQQRCASVSGCAHFTFFNDGGCHLQNSSANGTSSQGCMSGPPTCVQP